MCQECQEIEVGHSESSEAWDQTVEYGSEDKLLNSGIKEETSGKICSMCKALKPLGEFGKDKNSVDGHYIWCKICRNFYGKITKERAKKREKPIILGKICSACTNWKESGLFYKNSVSKDGLDYLCIECSKINKDLYLKKKKEQVKDDLLGEKVCTSCGVKKAFTFFPKNAAGSGGVSSVCKLCKNALSKKRTNSINFLPDLSITKVCTSCGLLKKAEDYYLCTNHTDGLTSACKVCTAAKVASLDFKYDSNGTKICRDCGFLKGALDFPARHSSTDGLSCYCKVCTNRRNVESRKRNVDFNLRSMVRSRFSGFLKKMGLEDEVDKEAAIKFMGCTPNELAKYLENLFYINSRTGEEMNWTNHSTKGWHIDHIIPLAKVDLTDPRQLKRVCHHSNLRPLWSKENHRKNAKLPENWDKEAWLREIEND